MTDEVGYPGTFWVALVGYAVCDLRPSPDGPEIWVSWGGPKLARVLIENPTFQIPRGHVLFVRGDATIAENGVATIVAEDWFSLSDPRRRAARPRREVGPVTGVFVNSADYQVRRR